MSAPWIKLHTDLMQHPKTAKVLGARGGANAFVGLISVWCWAGGTAWRMLSAIQQEARNLIENGDESHENPGGQDAPREHGEGGA